MSSSSQQASSGWANGVPPKSRKAKNKALRKLLPNHNQPICKSYSEFTRFLLGYTKTHQEYPDPPNHGQIMNLAPLIKEVIFLDNSVFATYDATTHSDKTDWSPFKALLLLDLDNNQLGDTFTFEWDAQDGEKSRWNQVMIFFTVKHWIFARRASAFENFALDLEMPNELIQIGIVTRWVIGRIEEIKSGFWDQNKVEQRTRSRKRRELWEYRQDTLEEHLPEYLALLPGPDCGSDTEDDPHRPTQRSIQPEWRSVKYGNWLHEVDRLSYKSQASVKLRMYPNRRLDTRRAEGHTVNPLAKVCPNLPENCYDSAFLKHYNDLEKLELGVLPSSSMLDEALTAITQRLL